MGDLGGREGFLAGQNSANSHPSGPSRRHRTGYLVLACLTTLLCLLASPSSAKIPSAKIASAKITSTKTTSAKITSEITSAKTTSTKITSTKITPAKITIDSINATPIAQSIPTSTTEADRLDQSAREQYAAGQFEEAATAFQQAAQRYQDQADPVRQALSLSNLSLSYQQLGVWSEANQAISESLALLESELQQGNTPDRQSAYAQALDISAKLQLSQGQAEQAIATWDRSIKIHQDLGHTELAAVSQINQAQALQHLGLYTRSIAVLETALKTPEQPTLLLAGLPQNASAAQIRDQLTSRLQALPTSVTTVVALQNLGEALQVVRNLGQAKIILQYSLKLAEDLALPDAVATSQLNLANVIRTQAIAKLRVNHMTVEQAVVQLNKQLSQVQQDLQYQTTQTALEFDAETEQALNYYQQASDGSSSSTVQAQAQLNRLNLLLDKQQWSAAETAVAQIEPLLSHLPANRSTIDAQINFAQSLMRLESQASDPLTPLRSSPRLLQAAKLLATAHQQAIELGDTQAESYVLGSLGHLYERTQQWSEAAQLTQQALDQVKAVSVTNLPYSVTDADLAYRWQYQLGRILTAQNDREAALQAYEAAATTLQNRLRLDVASSNLNYQFSFNQEAQQPVHRDLMDLLLRDQPSQKELQQVREVSSSLLEAQLTSFLQEPCAVVTPQQVDNIVKETAQKTAIFYPVILPDRLEVIVKLPNTDTLYHYRKNVLRDQFLEQLNLFQIALEEEYTFDAVKTLGKQFYDWLVEPAKAQLESAGVDTLIFTLDRRLQSVPMAALYDGEHYLIEKYAVSEILGLEFGSAESLQPEELKVMAAGLSFIPTTLPEQIQEIFLPLPNVSQELTEIEALKSAGIGVVTLQDQNFTLSNFNTRLNEARFPVVHLATHGQFSVDPQRTFLLTAQNSSGDGLIDVDELAALFRVRGQIRLDSIDLLILNACETAAGDDLATLGLAGTAVRSGAQSAIASLWTLDDTPSVDFTKYLYENLRQPNLSKAEVLRRTQLALMQDPRYQHPRYWSPYILAGNWLPLITSRAEGSADSR